ncbi:MAG: hypothetical protein ABUJ98_12700 [Hyphomicrobium sp.]
MNQMVPISVASVPAPTNRVSKNARMGLLSRWGTGMAWDWKNRAATLWEREVVKYLNVVNEEIGVQPEVPGPIGSPIAQMLTISSPGILIQPGDILAPMDTAWNRNVVADKTTGIFTVPNPGVYTMFFSTAGTIAAQGTAELFSIRLNNVVIFTIKSSQQQSSEGVEAAVSGFLRITEPDSVVDTILDLTSDAPFTMNQVVLAMGWQSGLDGITDV